MIGRLRAAQSPGSDGRKPKVNVREKSFWDLKPLTLGLAGFGHNVVCPRDGRPHCSVAVR